MQFFYPTYNFFQQSHFSFFFLRCGSILFWKLLRDLLLLCSKTKGALELKKLKRSVQQPKVLFKIDKLKELDLVKNRHITLVYNKYNKEGFMKGFC